MNILYPSLLWMLLPLAVLMVYRPKVFSDTVHLIILMLMVIALSRPVLEQTPQIQKIEAKDVIIALDVSYSMRADDIKPNRYEYAKAVIDNFIQNNVNDNITLIAFTTNPLLLSPPTTDHQLISLALRSLQTDNILTHGTSLKKLLDKVASLPINDKNLILITDGGEETGLQTLQEIIEAHAIHPIILAMGTATGSTIPKTDGTLLKDAKDNLVVSHINPLLQNLAANGSGEYFLASGTAKADVKKLQDAIDTSVTQKNLIEKNSHSYTELYPLPLLMALILFILLHTKGVKYLLIFAALAGTQASASWLDTYRLQHAYESYSKADYNTTVQTLDHIATTSLQSRYAQANSAYKLGEYNKALKLYRSIQSTSPQIKQKLYYNIANCYTMLSKYDKARSYYTKALQLGDDEDAKVNLALIANLKEKKESLGIANPQSQESSSSKSDDKDNNEASKERSEDQPSSGSGDGGSMQRQKNKEKMKLIQDYQNKEQPMSSKAYEMINKGYINEKQPW